LSPAQVSIRPELDDQAKDIAMRRYTEALGGQDMGWCGSAQPRWGRHCPRKPTAQKASSRNMVTVRA